MNFKAGDRAKVIKKRSTASCRLEGQIVTIIYIIKNAYLNIYYAEIKEDPDGIWLDELVPIVERNLPSWW